MTTNEQVEAPRAGHNMQVSISPQCRMTSAPKNPAWLTWKTLHSCMRPHRNSHLLSLSLAIVQSPFIESSYVLRHSHLIFVWHFSDRSLALARRGELENLWSPQTIFIFLGSCQSSDFFPIWFQIMAVFVVCMSANVQLEILLSLAYSRNKNAVYFQCLLSAPWVRSRTRSKKSNVFIYVEMSLFHTFFSFPSRNTSHTWRERKVFSSRCQHVTFLQISKNWNLRGVESCCSALWWRWNCRLTHHRIFTIFFKLKMKLAGFFVLIPAAIHKLLIHN